jgi:hypothetical protein
MGTAISNIQKELAEANFMANVGDAGAADRLYIRGKEFTLPTGERTRDPIVTIITAATRYNAYYDVAYDPENSTPPACFAVGDDGASLAPHDDATTPQADSCAECPHNQWRSGKGKGKACSNKVRLAAVAPDFGAKDSASKAPFVITLPPTSAGNWGKYVKMLKHKGLAHPMQVVTELSFDPQQSYPKLNFVAVKPTPEDALTAAWGVKSLSEALVAAV